MKNIIKKLKPCVYKYNKIKPNLETERKTFGLIAQELDEIFPKEDFSIVSQFGDYLKVDYIQLVPIIIKALQEVIDEVEELKMEKVDQKQRVNVIYLTTRCNLDCDYCYEKVNRDADGFKHKDITKEEIDNFIMDIEQREQNFVSTICVMGGEPFLQHEMFDYLVERIDQSKKSSGYALNMITNGTILTDEWIETLTRVINDKKISLSIHISYDGIGQHRRDKTTRTIDNIQRFNDLNIPFGISYTLTKDNKDYWVKDIIYLCEKFGHSMRQSNSTIRMNFAFTELGIDPFSNQFQKENIEPYAQYIYQKYSIPICSLVCQMCGKCEKSSFNGRSYMIPQRGSIKVEPMSTHEQFNHFNESGEKNE